MMYQRGYDNAALRFAYIPDFKTAEEKEEFFRGMKAGYKARLKYLAKNRKHGKKVVKRKNTVKRTKLFVGVTTSGKREVFRSSQTPTKESHGNKYVYVIGPFRTKAGAVAMAVYGKGNPHIQSVADAERIARQLEKEKRRV